MATVTIEIDGKPIEVEQGSMLIHAADAAGIYIPRFCYHEKLSIAANCRMCLVEVEKAPKPLPACATPVADGMKVFTRSEKAIDAQKGTMEFLLINHPLDCPICDQGGECDLQDLAVGYGSDVSRFSEKKRVVMDKNLGPLIATDMTRCIQCTRCVRFGQELAGMMELGATGRGEHLEIGTYVERTVDSELSGNMIDLCPVGALTSKPFRYSARSWELRDVPGIAPHDCVGSNLRIQVMRGKVKRVLPAPNEDVNEVWLSDRDRFSYEALNSDERLTQPRIKVDGQWQDTDWHTALTQAVAGIKRVVASHGAQQLGALASPASTTEEFYLLQKLMRALGSHNVDHRLRQIDFSNDAGAAEFPSLGQPIAALERRKAILLLGSNIRKEQPLLGLRVRKAALAGAKVMALNPLDYEFSFDLASNVVAGCQDMLRSLAKIVEAVSVRSGKTLPADATPWLEWAQPGPEETAIAETLLAHGADATILLGAMAQSHPAYATVHSLADVICELTGATLGVLPEANSVGAWSTGCVPHRDANGDDISTPGRDALAMLRTPLKGYLLFGLEPELDCIDSAAARAALAAADFVVSFAAFASAAADYANVQLPLAPFSETAGTFVSCEARAQSFTEAVPALGEARPGWKILRVLGNLLEQAGFEYTAPESIRDEITWRTPADGCRLRDRRLAAPPQQPTQTEIDLERIVEVPIYAVDALTRRAPALQATADSPPAAARINPTQASQLGFEHGDPVNVHMGQAFATLPLAVDARVPHGCLLVPGGYAETAMLGGPGRVRVVRA